MRAIIEGTTTNLLVDSAASTTLILDRTVTKRIDLPTTGRKNLTGAGKNVCPVSRVGKTQVKLGDRTIPAADVFASDLTTIGEFLKRRTDGVIGGDLFRGQAVTLNFSRDLLLLSARVVDSPGQIVVPMVSLGGLCCAIEANLELNGRALRGVLVLDTGAPTIEVALTRSFAEKVKLLPNKRLGPVMRLPGLCGESGLGKFPAQVSLGVAGRRFPVDLWIGLDREGALNAAQFDGVLGGRFLARFREVTFDSVGKRLILKK